MEKTTAWLVHCTFKCKVHNVRLYGEPEWVDALKGKWTIDFGDMHCPTARDDDEDERDCSDEGDWCMEIEVEA